MAYNDGVQTSTTGLNIADSARSGGVARMNYETGIRQSDLNSAGGMGGINPGEIADGLMKWAQAGGQMALASKQEEEAKKRVAAAELKKAKAEQDFKNKTDAKSLFSSTGGENLETAGAAGAPFLPSTEDQSKLYTANAGLRKEYEKLYTKDKVDEEQAFINENAGDITDQLFEEWNALPPDDPAKRDFIQFAGVQLQNYKEKRHLENFSGLKHLGEVTADGKGVSYTQLEDHVAKKHREHVREQQDVFISNRITGSFNAKGVPTTIADFDGRVGEWKGKKFDVNGKKGDLIPRKQVVIAALEHMTEQVQYSLQNPNGRSTDKIFDSLKMIESLNDYNQLMDRGDGMGEKYEEYFKEARDAKTTLQNRERQAKNDAEKEGKKVSTKLNNKVLNEIAAVNFAIDDGNPPSKDDFKLLQVELFLRRGDIESGKFITAMTQLKGMAKSIDVNSESYIPAEDSEEAKILPDYTKTASKEFKSIPAVGKEQEKVIQSNDPSWVKIGKLKVLEAQSKRIKYQIDNTASHTEADKIASSNNLGGLQTRLTKAVTDCEAGVAGKCEVAQGIIDMVPTQGMLASDIKSWNTHKNTIQKELGAISGGKAATATTGKVIDLIGAVNDKKMLFADAEKEFKKLKNPSARDMEIFQTQTRAFRDKKTDDKGIEAGLRFESALAQETTVKGLKDAVEKELRTNKSLGFEARKNILKFQTKRILEIDSGNVKESKEAAKERKKEASQRSIVNHRTLFNELKTSAEMELYIDNQNVFETDGTSSVDTEDQGAFQKELQGVIRETKEKEDIKTAGDQEGKIRDKLLKMEMNPTPEELQAFQLDVDKIKHEPTRTRMNAILQGYGDKKKTKEEIDSVLEDDMIVRKKVRSSMTVMRDKLTDFVKAAEDPKIPNSASKAMTSLLEYRKTVLQNSEFQALMAEDPDNTNYQKEMDDTYTTLSGLQTKDEVMAKNKTNHKNSVNSLRDREVKTEQTYEDIFELEEKFTLEDYNSFVDSLGVSAELIDENGKVSNPSIHTAAVQDQLKLRARVAKEEHDQKNAEVPTKTDIQYLGTAEFKLDQIRDAVGDAEKNRLIDETNTWLSNGYTGVPPDTTKIFSTEDFRYFRNKVNSERPDSPKAFEPKAEALQIINSIFTGSTSADGSPVGMLALGEGNVLRNDIRTYFGKQFNNNIPKFKKPYMLRRDEGTNEMKVVDCNEASKKDDTCFDDKGLEFAQQLSSLLITPSETHPFGAGPPDENGRKSFNERLKSFKSTMLENLQRGTDVIGTGTNQPRITKTSGDSSSTWSLVNVTFFDKTQPLPDYSKGPNK
jgi:hypothetical protein